MRIYAPRRVELLSGTRCMRVCTETLFRDSPGGYSAAKAAQFLPFLTASNATFYQRATQALRVVLLHLVVRRPAPGLLVCLLGGFH